MKTMTDKNKNLFELSKKFIPGGVNSPVRAFSSVGGTPIFFKKGLGSRLWDENNKEYIDYINSRFYYKFHNWQSLMKSTY